MTKLNKKLSGFTLGDSSVENSDGGAFILSTALPSQQKAGYLDMIGEGGQFDIFCSTAQPCSCQFTFVHPTQGTRIEKVTAIDQEADLMRCTSPVPSGIDSYSVSILSGDGAFSSTSVTVTLSNGTYVGSTFYMDLTEPTSFTQVKRFQCRHLETVINPIDGAFIDPIQSEDPRIIYPFNFYTTNVGESLLQYQHNANQDWDCTLTPNADHTVHSWANENVYSRADCEGSGDSFCDGSTAHDEIMNAQDTWDNTTVDVTGGDLKNARSSFALAKQPYSVFQVPVSAAVAPKDYVSANYGIIGYAAEPVPSGSSSSCPAIDLPSNARWVKLWNFRATDITPPKYVRSLPGFGGRSPGSIACNPGGVSPSCEFNDAAFGSNCNAGGIFGCKLDAFSAALQLDASEATRIMGLNGATPACYNIKSNTSWMGGNETWIPSPYAFADATPAPPVSVIKSFPWNLFSDAYSINTAGAGAADDYVQTSVPGALAAKTPMESNPELGSFTNDNYTDNLFVVTSESVDDNLMRTGSSAVAWYYPVTYKSRDACDGVNRAAPTAGSCSVTDEINWALNVDDVGNPTNSGVYPLCVVQFYE